MRKISLCFVKLVLICLVSISSYSILSAESDYPTYRDKGCEVIITDTNWVRKPEIENPKQHIEFAALNAETNRSIILVITAIGNEASLEDENILEGLRLGMKMTGGTILEETPTTLDDVQALKLRLTVKANGQEFEMYGYAAITNGYLYQIFTTFPPGEAATDEALQEVAGYFRFTGETAPPSSEEVAEMQREGLKMIGEKAVESSGPYLLIAAIIFLVAVALVIVYIMRRSKKNDNSVELGAGGQSPSESFTEPHEEVEKGNME